MIAYYKHYKEYRVNNASYKNRKPERQNHTCAHYSFSQVRYTYTPYVFPAGGLKGAEQWIEF